MVRIYLLEGFISGTAERKHKKSFEFKNHMLYLRVCTSDNAIELAEAKRAYGTKETLFFLGAIPPTQLEVQQQLAVRYGNLLCGEIHNLTFEQYSLTMEAQLVRIEQEVHNLV